MNDYLGIVVSVLLLFANGFFVAAEFALISVRRDRLDALANQGKRQAVTVMRASENLSLMLAGAQLGITICSILLGRIAEPAIAHLLESPLRYANIPSTYLHPLAFTVALALVVLLHILLGEMVPKNIALAGPERAAMILVPPYLWYIKLIRPVISLFNWIANLGLKALRVKPKGELDTTVSAGQLTVMIGQSHDEGLIDSEEHDRLTRALESSARTVAEIAIPLHEVHSVKIVTDPISGKQGPQLGAIEQAVIETGYSRYPVRSADGTFTGYLHVKDILDDVADDTVGPETIIGIDKVHPLPVILQTTPLDIATTLLRRTSSHLAAVTDPNGRTVAVVALEDLVEEFVGTVRDDTHRI